MTQMTARYHGTCAKTGAKIRPGDTIDYDRASKQTTLVAAGEGRPLSARYKRTDYYVSKYGDSGRYVSDVFRTSGGTFYRNKAGRCEDAPCCGCCTI